MATSREVSQKTILSALSEGRTLLMEHEAKSVCKSFGIDVPRYAIAATEEEAVSRGDEIGYPLAAKIVSPNILHKSDIGGVILGLKDSEQVRAAYVRLREAARTNCPSAKIM